MDAVCCAGERETDKGGRYVRAARRTATIKKPQQARTKRGRATGEMGVEFKEVNGDGSNRESNATTTKMKVVGGGWWWWVVVVACRRSQEVAGCRCPSVL